ncbi:MAG: dapH [Bacteroidetes bacterium]|jgi:acetyltransferase-like isoleucine patch superfamily enzyme|nr:dapH [Bacteroidota bacterium]
MGKFADKIKANGKLKEFVHCLLMDPVRTRPRFWLRLLQVFYLKRGRKSVIYHSVRKDLVPFRLFSLGDFSIIEDFSCLNNAVGAVVVGNHSRIGIGNTIIGPVRIGNYVNTAQHVVLSGLNHNYKDIGMSLVDQGVSVAPISVGDNVWIGANAVILAGVSIGEHSVVGAGSVVTKNIPAYSVAVGNPASIIKQYDFEKKEWVKIC